MRRRLVLIIAATLALTGCSSPQATAPIPTSSSLPTATASPTASATPSAPPERTGFWRTTDGASVLAAGLPAPWSIVPLPDGGALISQRDDGVILHLLADGSVAAAGTVPGVVAAGEGGLLGLALWEDDDRRWLYAYHTAEADNRVVRMPLSGSGAQLALGAAETIFTGVEKANTHNGGRIAFGPDDMLYIGTGDAQNRDAPQDTGSLNGKILRITPAGAPAPGNPYGNPVFSLGHRNVQGLAWTADGTLWASEFGQDTWDELNRIEPGGNYGWPIVEGGGEGSGYIDPVAQWTTDQASPSGIAAIGETIFMTGLRGERLWQIDVSGGAAAAEPVASVADQGRLRDVVAALDGTLWVLTSNTDGRGDPRDGDDVLLRVPVATTG